MKSVPSQLDLFSATAPAPEAKPELAHLAAIPLPDGELYFIQNPRLPITAEQVFLQLLEETPWRSESITIYGKTVLQPRLMAWYGDAQARYRYSGRTFEPLPWTPLLQSIRECIEALTAQPYNSVFLTSDRDGRDSMGMHADDEKELGPQPVIASLSLGASRCLILKHKRRKDLKPVRLMLQHGTLLVMAGQTQTNWLHGIDKQSQPCGARLNLTFRQIVKPAPSGY